MKTSKIYTMVLGVAQDAGIPQVGCESACCRGAWEDTRRHRLPASLAIVQPERCRCWLIDASPALTTQLEMLKRHMACQRWRLPEAIFLTHGHIGHYTGLMYLGRETLNADRIPVYAMPGMRGFLQNNAPWCGLLEFGNIELQGLTAGKEIVLDDSLSITPIVVPHRAEYTETVGYIVRGHQDSVLYIPDIDRWEGLIPSIEEYLAQVSRAYLDGTFFKRDELGAVRQQNVPHPPIDDSLTRFARLPVSERAKIRFIHFNHTNPVVRMAGAAFEKVERSACSIAREGELFPLS